jgi:hypothetical protein
MKESHRKGVANHPDPEPCPGGRKTALEALECNDKQSHRIGAQGSLDRGICRLGIPKL